MTEDDIESAFLEASNDFNISLSKMRPLRSEDEGYCEANLVDYYSFALRGRDFRPFREFPIPSGRVDGLFFRNSTFLLVEAKQLHRESLAYVTADLIRLALLDLPGLLERYGCTTSEIEVFHISLCDCWKLSEKEAWKARTYPFLEGFETKASDLPNGQFGHHPYAWLLAYKPAITPVLQRTNGDEVTI